MKDNFNEKLIISFHLDLNRWIISDEIAIKPESIIMLAQNQSQSYCIPEKGWGNFIENKHNVNPDFTIKGSITLGENLHLSIRDHTSVMLSIFDSL